MRDTEYCNALYLIQCIQSYYKVNCKMTVNNYTVILEINFTDIDLSATFIFECTDTFAETYATLMEHIRFKINEWIILKTVRTENNYNEEKQKNKS